MNVDLLFIFEFIEVPEEFVKRDVSNSIDMVLLVFHSGTYVDVIDILVVRFGIQYFFEFPGGNVIQWKYVKNY